MSSLAYHRPDTIPQAVSLLAADPSARVLAGGTDLLIQIRSGRIAPANVIDIKRIRGLIGVRIERDAFIIGAATPCTALKADSGLMSAWPGVVEAANLIGSVQVRNRATIAGNICNASPAADAVPALIAAGATCRIAGPDGERIAAIEDVATGPGRTSLKPGEFVVDIRLAARPAGGGDAYLRLIPRTEMDIAVVGAGAALVLAADGICTAARIALGAVAPTALLVPAAGAALIGTKLDAAALDAMAAAVRSAARPIDDKRGQAAYRIEMTGVLAKRVVAMARQRAEERA
jgi:carbon-monoxide dehydrogenase medium subunit